MAAEGSGTAAQSPIAQTPSMPSTRMYRSTRTRPCSSSGTLSSREAGVRRHARRPDDRPGGDPLAGGERHGVGLDRLEAGAEADVDPATAELPRRVLGEPQIDLRQHPVGRLDQDPAHSLQPRPRVGVHRVDGEVLELGERLEAGVAAADEDVGEELLGGRSGSSLAFAASSVSITWFRSQIASARLLNPIAFSRPGTGSSRDTEPRASISWS